MLLACAKRRPLARAAFAFRALQPFREVVCRPDPKREPDQIENLNEDFTGVPHARLTDAQ